MSFISPWPWLLAGYPRAGPHDVESGVMTTDNKVVLFADVLGFAALTESYPLDVDRCRVGDRPLASQFCGERGTFLPY